MKRRDAEPLDRVAVLGRRVSHVIGELPARMLGVDAPHVAVPRLLGDDRRGRDRSALAIAADHSLLAKAERRDGKAVAETDAIGAGDLRERVTQRSQVGHVKPTTVDAASTA